MLVVSPLAYRYLSDKYPQIWVFSSKSMARTWKCDLWSSQTFLFLIILTSCCLIFLCRYVWFFFFAFFSYFCCATFSFTTLFLPRFMDIYIFLHLNRKRLIFSVLSTTFALVWPDILMHSQQLSCTLIECEPAQIFLESPRQLSLSFGPVTWR